MCDPLREFVGAGPGSKPALDEAEAALGIVLPDDYKAFLASNDGGEGFIGEQYLVLWRAGELEPFNTDYEIADYAPGLIGFGGNGGGDLFAFDTRSSPYAVAIVPCIGMSLDDAEVVAPSFSEFMRRLSQDPRSPID